MLEAIGGSRRYDSRYQPRIWRDGLELGSFLASFHWFFPLGLAV